MVKAYSPSMTNGCFDEGCQLLLQSANFQPSRWLVYMPASRPLQPSDLHKINGGKEKYTGRTVFGAVERGDYLELTVCRVAAHLP